ncbi:MAG: transposase, partial [Clostridia bacterium]|nr:transposase [Clostridia bacterium]
VIMPEHIHLILKISSDIKDGRMISAPTKSIMTVIGQMKRWVSKEIGFSVWQKSYYEHVIRNENDYIEKAQYILNNPLKWELAHDD